MTHMLHQPREVLRVDISDGFAIFSGAANLHRFDEPSTADIAASVRSLLGETPARVEVSADDATIAELRALLPDFEVAEQSLIDDSPDSAPEPEPEPEPETSQWGTVQVSRPRLEVRGRGSSISAMLIAVVIAVIVLCAAAIWFVMGRVSDQPEPVQPPRTTASTSFATPTSAPPETVIVSQDGLSVELPVGFSLEPDEDMWRATGPDPDFRLQFAVDPLYGVDPDILLDQVETEINEDPELTLLERADGQIRYRHMLADGSEALWGTWTDGGHQISIGCHTRLAPTTVQLAACTMANDSARFTPP